MMISYNMLEHHLNSIKFDIHVILIIQVNNFKLYLTLSLE